MQNNKVRAPKSVPDRKTNSSRHERVPKSYKSVKARPKANPSLSGTTGLSIGLLANRSLRSGPGSQLISFLREFEHYFRNVIRAQLFAVAGTYRSILRAGLFRDYGGLHQIAPGHQGGIVPITAMVVRKNGVGKEQHLDSVIYFIDPRDPTSTYPESVALKRECVVAQKSFLATYTAAREWASLSWFDSEDPDKSKYFLDDRLQKQLMTREAVHLLHMALEDQTVALIAHDRKKNDMLKFARENLDLLKRFKQRKATGTTGTLLNGELPSGRRLSQEEKKAIKPEFEALSKAIDKHKLTAWVRPESSGPRGGDVQIAEAVLRKECHKVLFFEDPHVSREHEADIQLLERTCRIPESNIMCLHDYVTASEWASNLRSCIAKGMSVPITLSRAFRILFNVELVLAPASMEGQSNDDTWDAILESAAYYLIGIAAHVAREKADLAHQARIAVTWGYAIHELCEALLKVGSNLRSFEDNIAGERFLKPGNVIALPMVGIMGTTDPRVEATRNAKVLAEALGGTSVPLSSCAFIDRRTAEVSDFALSDWDRTDIAVYTCEAFKPQFGSKALAPMPSKLYEQMKDQAIGEVGGLFLKEDGKKIEPREYERIGMSWEQLQRVAKRGGAVFMAGIQNGRVRPALACLRGGLVSSLITDRNFAWKIIETELQVRQD